MERSGWNFVGKISPSPRYEINITKTDLISSAGGFGRRVKLEKLEKIRYF